MPGQTVEVEGRRLSLTNLDEVMYPATGTTKAEVLAYLDAVAPAFLAHCADRPATRRCWPEGTQGPAFLREGLDAGTPAWVLRREIQHRSRTIAYPLVNDLATLTWLGQVAALEVHVPQWRFGRTGTRLPPDRLVLDLDPGPGVGLPECARVARLARPILAGLGLTAFPVTNGSRGIHLYAALDGHGSVDAVNEVARELARHLATAHPDLVVADVRASPREGRVLVDWSQNDGAKTTIAPYSLRGRERPFVAAPRTWEELDDPGLGHLELGEVVARLADGDPLEPLAEGRVAAREPAGARVSAFAPVAPDPGSRDRLEVYRSKRDPARAPDPVPAPGSSPERTGPPMLAVAGRADDLTGPGWAFEMKWDGFRAFVHVDDAVRVTSRSGRDLTETFPELARIQEMVNPAALPITVDGEIVALDRTGHPSFRRLQRRANLTGAEQVAAARAVVAVDYMAFDLLHMAGRSVRGLPYRERRELLYRVLRAVDPVHVPPAFDGDLSAALATSRRLGLEGVVAKRRDGAYVPGRSRGWVKVKHARDQEVVVVGWRPGLGARGHLMASLLLAVPDEEGLRYVGRVGSGFTDAERRDLPGALVRVEEASVRGVPAADARDAVWVRPDRVGEVGYGEWTGGHGGPGKLRHAVWRGWRPDKSPAEVRIGTAG